ncbi:MAG: competence protein CoiA family protein [Chlamydiales bacterium]|nr:competence protein CoiA family protein [Chlamydiales bacterium]
MQLYALDENQKLLFVKDALKQKDYICIECGSNLRVRLGEQRHAHFYHPEKPLHCSQSGKSETHIALQLHLQKIIPACLLEKRMPSIGRIADVVWEEKKLIFEIQCSFISKQELLQRNLDYASLDYKVIWILHDKTFNKHTYLAAEKALIHHPFFRTNFNEKGYGIIYDQFDLCKNNLRTSILKPFPVSLNDINPLPAINAPHLPSLQKRSTLWPYYFKGDLMDLVLIQKKEKLLQKIMEEEKIPSSIKHSSILSLTKKAKTLCSILMNMILERTCR